MTPRVLSQRFVPLLACSVVHVVGLSILCEIDGDTAHALGVGFGLPWCRAFLVVGVSDYLEFAAGSADSWWGRGWFLTLLHVTVAGGRIAADDPPPRDPSWGAVPLPEAA